MNQINLHLSIENEEIENLRFEKVIQVSNNQTVEGLKNYIQQEFAVEVLSIRKNHFELPDGELNNIGIVDNHVITVIQKLQCVHVYNILTRGERNEFLYSNMENVSSLQERIATRLNIASDALALFYNNERMETVGDPLDQFAEERKLVQTVEYLEESNLIKNYQLENNSTIIYCEIRNFGDLEVRNSIKEGQNSQIYIARIVGNDTLLLIKKYSFTDQSCKPILRELVSFAKLEDRTRIVNLMGFYKEENYFYIAMEYMERGSLHSYVKTNRHISEELIAKWSKQILEGLAYLHKNRIIHCDLKSSNILLDSNLNIKISGFNLAKLLAGANSESMIMGFMQSKPGTCNFMAPEVHEQQKISSKADMWSFGAVLVELVTGKRPFHGMESIEIIKKIAETRTIDYDANGRSLNLQDFIGKCLKANPQERLNARQLLEHDFLRR